MSIVTSFLPANYKENLMTRFSANKQKPLLNACLYLIMLPWQRDIRQLNYQKVEICVVNLLAAAFGNQRIKGFRGTGKWNVQRYQKLCSATLKQWQNFCTETLNKVFSKLMCSSIKYPYFPHRRDWNFLCANFIIFVLIMVACWLLHWTLVRSLARKKSTIEGIFFLFCYHVIIYFFLFFGGHYVNYRVTGNNVSPSLNISTFLHFRPGVLNCFIFHMLPYKLFN